MLNKNSIVSFRTTNNGSAVDDVGDFSSKRLEVKVKSGLGYWLTRVLVQNTIIFMISDFPNRWPRQKKFLSIPSTNKQAILLRGILLAFGWWIVNSSSEMDMEAELEVQSLLKLFFIPHNALLICFASSLTSPIFMIKSQQPMKLTL